MSYVPTSLAFIGSKTSIHSYTTKQYMKMIEVERKFVIPTKGEGSQQTSITTDDRSSSRIEGFDMENKLYSLGFTRHKESIPFEDWYFDLPSPYWILSTQDKWFRYRQYFLPGDRQEGTGHWQLKRSIKIRETNQNHVEQSTVYEELEGEEALYEVLSVWDQHKQTLSEEQKNELLSQTKDVKVGASENIPLFHEPWEELGLYLKPFARFITHRASWVLHSNHIDRTFENLTLDLDTTDFGYNVGEAEILVHSNQDIPSAQEKISRFLEVLLDDASMGNTSEKVLGKLEVFLMEKDIEHYQACIQAGTLQKSS
jgi:hypothetical protein